MLITLFIGVACCCLATCLSHLSCRYGQVVASDSTSTVLADLIGSNSTSTYKGPTHLFDKGVARLTDLIVEASFGITEPIRLSLPADAVVMPAFVNVIFGVQCPPGDEESTTMQGNTVCQPCTRGYYENSAGLCELCPNSVDCDEASTVSDWKLHAGHWRTDDESADVRKCRFGVTSCPGDGKNQAAAYSSSQGRRTTSSSAPGPNPYCSPNHVGHLCSACAEDFFLGWTGDGKCYQCQTGRSDWSTIGLLVGVFVFVASCLACVYKFKKARQKEDTPAVAPSALFMKIEKVHSLAKFKVFTLFLAAQVKKVCARGAERARAPGARGGGGGGVAVAEVL